MKNKLLKAFLCLVALLCTATEGFAFGLPTMTTDAENPVLYRIKNTRRSIQAKANYITSAGSLSANREDAVVVYFVGTITDGVVQAKMYDNATGLALATVGDNNPAADVTSNFTWSAEGTDVYLKEKVSAQTSTYHGLLISMDGRFTDTLTGEASGGDVWYVGSSNPVAWAYSGQFDGSIFDLEPVAGYMPELSSDTEKIYYRLYNMYTGKYAVYRGTASSMGVTGVNAASEASLFYFMPGVGELDQEVYPGGINVDIFAEESGDYQLRSYNSWELHSADSRLWFLCPMSYGGYDGFYTCYTTSQAGDALRMGSSEIKYAGAGKYNVSTDVIWQVEFVKKKTISADANITSITWRLMDGEDVVMEETKSGCVEGDEITTSLSVPGVELIGSTTVVAGAVDQTIDLSYTIKGDAPFQYSADYANAKWYTITVRGKHFAWNAEQEKCTASAAPSQPRKEDLFAFVGKPWNLKVINAALGEDVALKAENVNNTPLKGAPIEEAMSFKFENNSGHFVFAELNNPNARINDFNNEGWLGFWNSSASATDGGSTFTFAPVDEEYVKDLFDGNVEFLYTKTEADVTTFNLAEATNYDAELGKFTANGGWTFDTPKDLTDYKWLVVTTTYNASTAGGEFRIADANGKSYGGEEHTGARGKMWLDRWNNQICATVNLDALLKDGFALDQVASLQFTANQPVSAVYLTNYEAGQAIANTQTWGACTGDYVREYAHLAEGEYKFGTIALKYAAAVSGAQVYTVDSFDETSMTLALHTGVLEAGVPYFYVANDHVGLNGEGNSNVNFFRVDGNAVSGDWSDNNARDNGLIGYYDGGFWPGAGALNGCYILADNQLHKVTGGTINLGKNRCFFDPAKYQGPKSSEAKTLTLSVDGDATAIETVESSNLNAGKIYDMNGREVKSMKKGGVYLMNGMKLYIK